MSLIGGGSSQSTSSVTSNIDFSPILNFGDGNEARFDKAMEQVSSVSPKLDDSFGMAASVGVLGGSGGPAQMRKQDDSQPTEIRTSGGKSSLPVRDYAPYLIGGLAIIGGVYLLKSNKKGKSKK